MLTSIIVIPMKRISLCQFHSNVKVLYVICLFLKQYLLLRCIYIQYTYQWNGTVYRPMEFLNVDNLKTCLATDFSFLI